MTETNHNTLWELFEAIKIERKKSGAEIIPFSDPKRLLIGWLCNDNVHYVRLVALRTRRALILPFEDDELYRLITELVLTPDGRQKISNILSSECDSVLGCFYKMLELKAFW